MKRTVDIMSIIGVILAFGLMVFGIVFGEDDAGKPKIDFKTIESFIDPASIIIVVGGVIAAVLYAPKSGEETRKDVENVITDMAQKYTPEINEAKRQALTSIDVMRYRLEQQYNKINENIKAKQLAKAKQKETNDYEVN